MSSPFVAWFLVEGRFEIKSVGVVVTPGFWAPGLDVPPLGRRSVDVDLVRGDMRWSTRGFIASAHLNIQGAADIRRRWPLHLTFAQSDLAVGDEVWADPAVVKAVEAWL